MQRIHEEYGAIFDHLFSIGLLAFTLHISKPLFTNSTWSRFRRNPSELKSLPHVLPRLPHRVCVHRVVPCLAKEFVNRDLPMAPSR